MDEKELDDIYQKARKTLKHYMKRLLLFRKFLFIDAEYKQAKNQN